MRGKIHSAPAIRVRIPNEETFNGMLIKLVSGKEVEFETPTSDVKMILADIGFDNIKTCLQNAINTINDIQNG